MAGPLQTLLEGDIRVVWRELTTKPVCGYIRFAPESRRNTSRDFVGQGLSSTMGTYGSSLIHTIGHLGPAATFPICMKNDIDTSIARSPDPMTVNLYGQADGR